MNENLRAHVTRVGFDLTLGRTHIAALVLLDQQIKRNAYIYIADGRSPFTMWHTGAMGLIERGLITHTLPIRERNKDGTLREISVRRTWHITKAGRLVINLLKESGVYDEYTTDLVRREERTRERIKSNRLRSVS